MRILDAAPGGALPGVVAAVALAVVSASVLVLAAGPIDTSDFWFHARAGEMYASEGPWPKEDRMLHTAHADAPVQHEWLFGVGLYALDATGGFPLVRVVHAGFVLLILFLVGWLFLRTGASHAAAFTATLGFVVLAWPRLIQMRPDLVTIPATLGLFAILMTPREAPSWKRVAAACALTLVWANVHSLFGLGPPLVLAGLTGVVVRALVLRWAGLPGGDREWHRARRLGFAVLAMLGVALANPRGWQQHLTFFSSSRNAGIWAIRDEWLPFNPFVLPSSLGFSPISDLAWGLTDLLAVGVVLAVLVGGVRFVWRRDATSLDAVDPALLAWSVASLIAIAVSVRFLWLSIFPLLFLLSFARPVLGGVTQRAMALRWVAAVAAVGLAVALFYPGGLRARVERLPSTLRAYVTEPFVKHGMHAPGVNFLMDTELEGNLYNRYTMGGFLGYWLSPRVRTFVDGRTEHYPEKVLDDYFRIVHRREAEPGETALEALDRRQVDVFFGVGLPAEGEHIYTTTNLEGVPGWRLVFRAPGHAIYLRDDERNRENWKRIVAHYAALGVPFDPDRGLDPDRLVEAAPEWMVNQGLLPAAYATWLEKSEDENSDVRLRALNSLGRTYALLGAYDSQARVDAEALAEDPDAKGPLRRNVYSALHEGRSGQALEAARALVRVDPMDPRSLEFLRIARSYASRLEIESGEPFARATRNYREKRIESDGEAREEAWLIPPESLLDRLFLLTDSERRDCCQEFD